MLNFATVSSEVLLRAESECVLVPLGVLFEKETVAQVMADETLRPFFGLLLQNELMPLLPEEGRDDAVVNTCRVLSARAVSPRTDDRLDGLIGDFKSLLLPHIGTQTPLLLIVLSAVIMLFCGARKSGEHYTIIGWQGDNVPLKKDSDALYMFSRLSCDMQPDSLAYAVLSDEAVWGRDLRKTEGMEEAVTDILRDIQLLGLYEVIVRAVKKGGIRL